MAKIRHKAKILLFHPGTQHAFYTARALQNSGHLLMFCTSIYNIWGNSGVGGIIKKMCQGRSFYNSFERRMLKGLDSKLVRTWPIYELMYILARKMNFSLSAQEKVLRFRNNLFAGHCASLALKEGVGIIWGYDTASLKAFCKVKERGLACVLDQSIADVKIWEEESKQELATFPEWKGVEQAFPKWRGDQACRERNLADWIVTGSNFCKKSFARDSDYGKKYRIIPYGANLDMFYPVKRSENGGCLNLLFVGNTGLRKGLQYLLAALKILPIAYKLIIAGQVQIPGSLLDKKGLNLEIAGYLSQRALAEYYRWADVFCFPSLFEGAPMVLAEAMGCGAVPVSTEVGSWIVRDGIDGFIVPMRDPGAIADRLIKLSDLSVREEMSKQAISRAKEFSWEKYELRIKDFAIEIVTSIGL